ncbi:MAG TPA: SurA N-terminal domain-containing protein [Verrucomicrobiae bacterium]|nr:SurA N-terminal domain-containing protein [Verrucomicrobiae bacterium]
MIGTIRKHQTWLWIIIAALTILSFVIFGPTNTRMGNAFSKSSANYGMLAGKPITQKQYSDANKEVVLGYFLQNQQWPRENVAPEIQRQTYQRLFLIQKQKELGIEIGEEAVATVARRMLGAASLDDFTDKVLKPAGLNADDFDRFLRHELGMEQLTRVAGLSGKLVTPQEADTLYRLEHQDLQTSIVFFSASNYLAGVVVTPEQISKFYSNQVANYKIPEQVQVEYVRFALSNYTAQAMATLTNLDQIVENNVQQLGTNLYHGAKTPAESKEAIRNEIIRHAKVLEARKAALAFAEQLDTLQPPNRDLSGFEKLAASNHMTLHTTAPFDREFGPSPSELVVPPEFTRKAFELTKDDPFQGPIVPDELHPSDVFVIALKDHIPARIPPFREIEAKVTADYRFSQALQLAQQASIHFATLATNALAHGKSFNTIAADAGLKPESLPPFNLNTQSLPEIEDRVNFRLLRQIAFSTPPGKIGPPAGTRDGAFVLYVEKRLPVDEEKMKKEFPSFLAYVRQSRQSDAFNQWFSAEVRRDPEFIQTLQQVTEQMQKSGGSRQPSS